MADSPEDKRKVEKLYEKYHKLMYVLAYNILKNHEDAEDAVIASWEKIICHLDKISEIDCQETKSFFVIVVERTAIDYYRKNKRQSSVQILLDEYEESPYFATKDKTLENLELYEVLRHIPKKYSEVLLLYYVNGFTGKEIANLLGIKEDAVMTRLSRGRKQLKKELSGNE
jgi:RNA polymerase sigma-70 factor (ECF subfamily)